MDGRLAGVVEGSDVDTPSDITIMNGPADPGAGNRPALSRRRALANAGALVGVLGVGWLADALASLPPGHTTSGPQSRQAGAFTLRLTLAPAQPVAGVATSVTIAVRDLAGQPGTPARFRGALDMPAMGMEPVEVAWQALPDGEYRASLTFPMSGAWSLVVTLLDASQHASTARFDIAVR